MSFGAGCLCPIAALVNGPIIGFFLTFFVTYLISVLLFAQDAKDAGLAAYISYLIYGSIGAVPFAFFIAITSGVIIGFYGGLASGIMILLAIILTTKWLPPVERFVVISIVMAVVGAVTGAGVAIVSVYNGVSGFLISLLFILGGGLFGLISGLVITWPLAVLSKPRRKPWLTTGVVIFYVSFHLLLPVLILGSSALLVAYKFKYLW